jgi:hypothetical protein
MYLSMPALVYLMPDRRAWRVATRWVTRAGGVALVGVPIAQLLSAAPYPGLPRTWIASVSVLVAQLIVLQPDNCLWVFTVAGRS